MKGMKFSKAIIEQRANTQRGKKRNKVSGKNNYFYKEVDDSFIIKLHKEGKSVPEIYNITGITKRIIHTRLKWNNLKCNNRFAKKIVDTNKIHYYVQQGLSYKEISNLFNVSETIISKNYRTSEFYQGRRTSWDTIHMRQAKRVPNESIK